MRPRAATVSSARGWDADTDVFFTTDHGELQGDYGLIFKGPFHTDSLMRLPMVWRPAPSAGVAPAVSRASRSGSSTSRRRSARSRACRPGVDAGRAAPDRAGIRDASASLCEWDSQFPGYGMHLRSIYRDGWLCTAYEPSTVGEPNGLEEFFAETGMFGGGIGPISTIEYDGTEGELYDVDERSAPVGEPLGRPAVQGRARRPRRRSLRHPPERTAHPRGRTSRVRKGLRITGPVSQHVTGLML